MGNVFSQRVFHNETLLTWDEIRTHGYIVAHGRVYDPGLLDHWKHPGGSIAHKYGSDCTRDYDFHRKNAHALWDSMRIGRVKQP
jgi:predicted heme/steroid binding protein